MRSAEEILMQMEIIEGQEESYKNTQHLLLLDDLSYMTEHEVSSYLASVRADTDISLPAGLDLQTALSIRGELVTEVEAWLKPVELTIDMTNWF